MRSLILLTFATILIQCKISTKPLPEITEQPGPDFKLSFEQLDSPARYVSQLAFDTKGRIFISGDKIYRSLDSGHTWQTVFDNFGPTCFAIRPEDNSIVFSFTGSMGGGGIITSNNHGASWERNSSFIAGDVLACSFIGPQQIMVGRFAHDESGGGLSISNDNGVSWIEADLDPYLNVYAIFPFSEQQIVLGCYIYGIIHPRWEPQVYYSANAGNSWHLARIDSEMTSIISFSKNSKDIIFGGTNASGLYCSNDLGMNWKFLALRNNCIWDIAISKDDHMFICSDASDDSSERNQILYSLDAGKTWAIDSTGNYGQIQTIEIGPDNYLYFGSTRGLYKSTSKISSLEIISIQEH